MNKVLIFLIVFSIFLSGCNSAPRNEKSIPSIQMDSSIKAPTIEFRDTSALPIIIPQEETGNGEMAAVNTKKLIEQTGLVRYFIPDSMKIGVFYKANIRISKEKDSTKITINMPEGKTACIRVGSRMEVKLIDPDNTNFEITALSSTIQTVEDDADITVWEWTVKPLKGGHNRLKLLITIKQKDLVKDIPVFDKEIYVQSSTAYEIITFLKANWAVLLPSVFIPFIGFVWHLFFKKKSKPSDEDEDND